MKDKDEEYIRKLVKDQVDMGADVLDIHTRDKVEEMEWMIPLVESTTDKPISIDTDDEKTLKAALEIKSGPAFINSINGEQKRLETFLPIIEGSDADVIALAIGEKGIPKTPEGRVEVCRSILKESQRHGLDKDRLYFDPLVMPLSSDDQSGAITIKTLELIKKELGGKTTVGLTNISHGLPRRTLIDQALLLSSLRWLDSALMNPLDRHLMASLTAGKAVLGMDRFCRRYTRAFRKGSLV